MEKFYDTQGKLIEEGDICFNTSPAGGEFWLVKRYTARQKLKYKPSTELYYSQYGRDEIYFMDINEPEGFKIAFKHNDTDYNAALREVLAIGNSIVDEDDLYLDEEEE